MPISEAESAVMEVLWARSPLGAEEVFQSLSGSREWQEATVQTLLNRLLRKGAVRAPREGRRYLYHPVLEREAWLRDESQEIGRAAGRERVCPYGKIVGGPGSCTTKKN